MKVFRVAFPAVVVLVALCTLTAAAEWKPQTIHQLNGAATATGIPAELQIVSEPWHRVVAVPYIVYMPERNRVLMLVNCDTPHQAMVLWSDDRGTSWSQPQYLHTNPQGQPDTGMCTSLTYLGRGKVMATGGQTRWFSTDYGKTWSGSPISGKVLYAWDPHLVERDSATGKVQRIVEAGYMGSMEAGQHAWLRASADEGRTWTDARAVPQWSSANEVAMIYAKNGDLVAACRTNISAKTEARLGKGLIDHYEGLGVSISKDRGATWSEIRKLYDWGRHHPSLVLMPNGDLVMTYVVRKGYADTADGFPQFGIEAVVSHDNGQTWDLDHRYLLCVWKGNRKMCASEMAPGPQAWWASSQATSSVLLPEGSILTAFGTGYRSQPGPHGESTPRDVGLVHWRLSDKPLNGDRTIRDAAFDSATRNEFDPQGVLSQPRAAEK